MNSFPSQDLVVAPSLSASDKSIPTVGLMANNAKIMIRQDGTRHWGCDESSGWIWYSARLLESILVTTILPELMERKKRPSCHDDADTTDSITIFELGSGTGWLSLQLACYGAIVTATERPGAMPLLIRNVISNQERIMDTTSSTNATTTTTTTTTDLQITCQELDWCEERNLDENDGGPWDLFVGSDLIYVCESHVPLIQTLVRYHCQSCVLTWEERKPMEEANFVSLCEQHNFHVDSLTPVGRNPETDNVIWMLRMSVSFLA